MSGDFMPCRRTPILVIPLFLDDIFAPRQNRHLSPLLAATCPEGHKSVNIVSDWECRRGLPGIIEVDIPGWSNSSELCPYRYFLRG
jgi:hypothetical protein